MASQTYMRGEILDIPQATARLLSEGRDAIKFAAKDLERTKPLNILTVARGSSDHASLFLKYACELELGVPVASIGPSIASIFGAKMHLASSACIAISQSGKSPDIVSMASSARQQGALSIAITNETASPLAQACDHTIAIKAGVEKSVAATKTFVTSAVAGLALLAHWSKNSELIEAIDALPDVFAKAVTIDWPQLRASLKDQNSLYVLGRGPSLAMANEAALKFKETCRIHAESYSSAEVLHGPVSIVGDGYPVLALAARDATEPSIVSVAEQLAVGGASVFITSEMANSAQRLEFAPTGHPLTDPLALIVSFYSFIEKLAQDRGLNPDQPRNLKKVTETL